MQSELEPEMSGASRHDAVSPEQLPTLARVLIPLLGLFFLVYPVRLGFMSDPSRFAVLLMIGGATLFTATFLHLMWRERPQQLALGGKRARFRVRAGVAVLALLASILSASFGPEWRVLFFYHVNVASGLMLPRRDAYIVTGCIALLAAVQGFDLGLSWLAVPVMAIGLWSTSFVVQVGVAAELRAAREELAQLAVAQERLRFARDLHDLLGHSLSLIALKSDLLERLLVRGSGAQRMHQEVRDLQAISRSAMTEVREAVSGYRQPSLAEELGRAETMLDAAGIQSRITSGISQLPKHVEAILTWVVREGVTNVVRHSNATTCDITLTETDSFVKLEIVNDADGLAPAHAHISGVGGSGLTGLRERMAASDGELRTEALSGGGFLLQATLPLGTELPPQLVASPSGASKGAQA